MDTDAGEFCGKSSRGREENTGSSTDAGWDQVSQHLEPRSLPSFPSWTTAYPGPIYLISLFLVQKSDSWVLTLPIFSCFQIVLAF